MVKKTPGIKVLRDGGAIIHQDIAADSVQIPQTTTAEGAGFGDVISDSDRVYAVTREPMANFLVYGVAADITDKWFVVNDPDTEEADPELDRTVQEALTKLKYPQRLTEAIESERTYGKSLLVGGFNDAKTVGDLKNPLKKGSALLQLQVYPLTVNGEKTREVQVESKDESPVSHRFGEPEVYKLYRGGSDYIFVHYTRVYELKTRSNASSVLDAIWDDLATGRNIRWGAGQWMYRTGSGFAVISFPAGSTPEQMQSWYEGGGFSNLTARTSVSIAQNSAAENDGMLFDFKGAAGHALDPTPFFTTNLEQFAIATGIPKTKLIGAQAGTVSGSDVNNQDYYKVISREQLKLDEINRWVIDHLADSGQLTMVKATVDRNSDDYEKSLLRRMLRRVVKRDSRRKTAKTYTIDWNSAFELSELDLATVENLHEDANTKKLEYMTPDEVRAEENLDPLPNGEGKKLKTQSLGLFGEEKGEEGNEDLKGNDKFLVVDLTRKEKQRSVKATTDSKNS